MTEVIDKEVEAIRTLLTALEPLESKVRASVLDYVMRRLGIQQLSIPADGAGAAFMPPLNEELKPAGASNGEVHISRLVDEKKPRNLIQMTTLLAYYLSHNASEKERKQTITAKDVQTYFKIANFKLPSSLRSALPNAKEAGYLDAVGDGEYKLNPVGYNLVVHNMPKLGDKKSAAKRVGNRRKAPAKAKKTLA